MPTGGFLGLALNVRGSGNAGANSIFLTPVVAQQNGSAVALLLDAPSATGSTTLKALVYDSAHSVLLASSAQVTSIAANYNRIPLTSPLSLVAGTTYYIGYVCSTSLPVTTGSGVATSWFVSGGQSVTTPANPLVGGATNASSLMVALELDGTGLSGFGFGPDQASGITLSLSNTVATISAGGAKGARSIVTKLPGAGKWYAEVLVGGTPNSASGIGLASVNWGTGQGTGVSYQYVETLIQTGTLRNLTTTVALGLSWGAGDVIGIAYDAVNNLLWFNKNNGSWFGASSTAGNPVTGTGGAAIQTAQWPIAVTTTTAGAGTATVFTLGDTAANLQYGAPSGYSAWSIATLSIAGLIRAQSAAQGSVTTVSAALSLAATATAKSAARAAGTFRTALAGKITAASRGVAFIPIHITVAGRVATMARTRLAALGQNPMAGRIATQAKASGLVNLALVPVSRQFGVIINTG